MGNKVNTYHPEFILRLLDVDDSETNSEWQKKIIFNNN